MQITRRKFLRLSALGVVAVGTSATSVALIEPYRPRVERIQVWPRRLPAELDGITIAQLSDFHYDSSSADHTIRIAVETTNALKPDLVVLTGDYVTIPSSPNGRWPAEAAEPCSQILAQLQAPLGILGVLGNHDSGSHAPLVTRAMEARGIQMLRNRSVSVEYKGGRCWIAGVDDVLGGGADLSQAVSGIPPDGFTVLLAHEPDYADFVSGYPVDLQLSGHSHGGQVCLPLVGAPYLPPLARKYPWGLRQVDRLTLYTNRGIGTIYMPMRLNSPPEITLLTLRSGS